jgi:capsule polysaccharide modification protein KpsS
MFAPASENAYKIQFQPGYRIFNPLNAKHQALCESFQASNTNLHEFFQQHHFAARLHYGDHVQLLITLSEAVIFSEN